MTLFAIQYSSIPNQSFLGFIEGNLLYSTKEYATQALQKKASQVSETVNWLSPTRFSFSHGEWQVIEVPENE